MAHLPVIPHVYRVAINHNDGVSRHCTNVMHVQNNDDPSPADLWDIIDAHDNGDMWDLLSNNFSAVSVDITPLDGTSASASFSPTDGLWAGGASGDVIPEAAFGMTFYTDLRGRRNRGRMFIGPITEPQVSNGVISSSPVTTQTGAWNTFANALVADASSTAIVVASYVGAVAHQVTHITGHTGVRTQRRRLVRNRVD